jgi:hypothetical protein
MSTNTATVGRPAPVKSASPKATSAPTSGKPAHIGQCVSVGDILRTAYQKWEVAGKPDGNEVKFRLESQRERAMPLNVHISLLRCPGLFRAILVEDGWAISTAGSENELDATHPEVGDQDAARIRLYRLGLLISHWLRIDFFPRARQARGKVAS